LGLGESIEIKKMSGYKDLKVWQINQNCVLGSLKLLNEYKRDYARGHIAKQLFRALTSIGANLAEGHESYEGKEYIRYINIAIRSAVEVDHWLATLVTSGSNSMETINSLEQKNLEVIKMLKGLRKSIEEKRP
jgi:four helix bundle protein